MRTLPERRQESTESGQRRRRFVGKAREKEIENEQAEPGRAHRYEPKLDTVARDPSAQDRTETDTDTKHH